MAATRVAANSGAKPIDVALIRYAVPALLLLPVWIPTFRKLRASPRWALLAMLGWGAPFLWLVTASLQQAKVVYLATIVPCTMPLFAIMAERIFFKSHFSQAQRTGFALIALAATLVIINAVAVAFSGSGGASGNGAITPYSLMLMVLAAMGWGSYVVAFKHTGLRAAEGATWVCCVSTLFILVIKLLSGRLMLDMTREQIAFNVVSQGLISGFVAVLLYTIAIGRLGPARAASFGVLVPVLATFFAWQWLGEIPTPYNLIALTLGTVGVAVVNGVVKIPPFGKRPV